MSVDHQRGGVLPRPRIPNVMGILNVYVAAVLILLSLSLAGYAAIFPLSTRAINEILKKADAELEVKRQAELKKLEEAEKQADTASRKTEIEAQRKEILARPKHAVPLTMDFEKLGMGNPKFLIFTWTDVATAILLDSLMLAAGVGMVRHRLWGLRLGFWTAAAKIVRLVLVYGFFIVVIIPPFAQGLGQMASEMVAQTAPTGGGRPVIDAAFMTRLYFITYTVMAVAMMLFGSIYPALSLWFLSRPGARAACMEPTRRYKELSGRRALGILNILFAGSLLVIGLMMSAYVAVLPLVGRMVNQVQAKAEAKVQTNIKTQMKDLDVEEKAAKTETEKQEIRERREALKGAKKAVMVKVDLGDFVAKDSRVLAFYGVELGTGVILNILMLVAGIGLVRHKAWGVSLGIGTAAAKIARLLLVYGYFTMVLSSVAATENGALTVRMLTFQQKALGKTVEVELDPAPMIGVNRVTYRVVPFAFIVLGSIFPVVSIWVLTRDDAAVAPKAKPPSDVQGSLS